MGNLPKHTPRGEEAAKPESLYTKSSLWSSGADQFFTPIPGHKRQCPSLESTWAGASTERASRQASVSLGGSGGCITLGHFGKAPQPTREPQKGELSLKISRRATKDRIPRHFWDPKKRQQSVGFRSSRETPGSRKASPEPSESSVITTQHSLDWASQICFSIWVNQGPKRAKVSEERC